MKTYKSLSRRLTLSAEPNSEYLKAKITKSADAAGYVRQFYGDDIEIYESFFIVLLNRANNTIGHVKISQGGVAGTVVDKVLIAKFAIESLASGVIIAHNHPSGNLNPSSEDIRITKEVRKALELFGIILMDSIIITNDNHYSLAENGQIN